MSVKNGGDEDRPSILNEKGERRIDGPPVGDRPLFVAAGKRSTLSLSVYYLFFSIIIKQIELFS